MWVGTHVSTHETTSPGQIAAESGLDVGRRHEVLGILMAALTLLAGLALGSYDARGGENLIGPLGTMVAELMASAFGVAAWLVPVEMSLAAVRLFTGRSALAGPASAAATLVVVLFGCALTHLGLGELVVFGGPTAGGAIGEVLGEVLRSLVGTAGASIVGVAILLVTLVLRTTISITRVARTVYEFIRDAVLRVRDAFQAIAIAWREAKALEAAEREAKARALEPKIFSPSSAGVLGAPDTLARRGAAPHATPTFVDDDGEDEDALDEDDDASFAASDDDIETDTIDAEDDAEEEDDIDAPALTMPTPVPAPIAPKRSETTGVRPVPAASGPRIIAPTPLPTPVPEAPRTKPAEVRSIVKSRTRAFELPPTSLLAAGDTGPVAIDAATLKANANRLVEKLEAYGVKGRVDEIHPGPVVTMYELEPASGTKVSKMAGLADDLAMALAAQKVRIVAPIPGKSRVGFELPNADRKIVYLRGMLEDPRWEEMANKAALPVALGCDIAGHPVYYDLAKMPHLLVAGATGQGKSVGLNVMLASLLCKKTPEEVRLLMIDPKVVELKVFDGIPHMLLPVVTDMKKASLALRWAVDEMERRYQLFADAGAKNIVTFNDRVERVGRGELSLEKFMPSRVNKVRAQGPDGEEVLLPPDYDEAPDALELPKKLPYVVVVVDEFADLMMVSAKDVEACVARLAQKARAAGIHVILATQRPSVDVITGMIKANFPTRMAFKVSQREDSRTILGCQGAEHLLGWGDMLLIPPGSSDPKRVHGALITEEELEGVCDHLRLQGKPVYDTSILEPRDEDGESGSSGEASDDPLYDKAVACVAQAGYCSISHIQRQLKVGYNKAATLVERMEKEGVVGSSNGKAGGRREVLIQSM